MYRYIPKGQYGIKTAGGQKKMMDNYKDSHTGTFLGGLWRTAASTIVDPLGIGYGSKMMGMQGDKYFKGFSEFQAGREGTMEGLVTGLDPTGMTDKLYGDDFGEKSHVLNTMGMTDKLQKTQNTAEGIGQTIGGVARIAVGDLSGISEIGQGMQDYAPDNKTLQQVGTGLDMVGGFMPGGQMGQTGQLGKVGQMGQTAQKANKFQQFMGKSNQFFNTGSQMMNGNPMMYMNMMNGNGMNQNNMNFMNIMGQYGMGTATGNPNGNYPAEGDFWKSQSPDYEHNRIMGLGFEDGGPTPKYYQRKAEYGRAVHPNVEYEAEGGEVVSYTRGGYPKIYGDGGTIKEIAPGMTKITGDKHNEGGIDMSGGEFVFSDHLKIDDKVNKLLKSIGA